MNSTFSGSHLDELQLYMIEEERLNTMRQYIFQASTAFAILTAIALLTILLSSWEHRLVFRNRILVSSLISIVLSEAIDIPLNMAEHDDSKASSCISVATMLRIYEITALVEGINVILLCSSFLKTELFCTPGLTLSIKWVLSLHFVR